MVKFAVCDDSINDLEHIQGMLCSFFDRQELGFDVKMYTEAETLLGDIKRGCFDAVFLDLEMPGTNGMETAVKIGSFEDSPEIIFVTNHDELVYKAYRFKAFGFIRKQYLEEELEEVLSDLIKLVSIRKRNIALYVSGTNEKINLSDIFFIQSNDHYIYIFLKDGQCVVRDKLSRIEREYSEYGLIRTHFRYLVNCQYIYSIEKKHVKLSDGRLVPLSRRRSDRVKEAFILWFKR